MATVELTKDNFEKVFTESEILIMDFWAPWCGPCKMFAPIFEASSEKYPDIVFTKINTEVEQELAAQFGIRSIPTLIIFREQIGIFSQPGALQASQFEELLGKVMELDMDQVRKEMAEQDTDSQNA